MAASSLTVAIVSFLTAKISSQNNFRKLIIISLFILMLAATAMTVLTVAWLVTWFVQLQWL